MSKNTDAVHRIIDQLDSALDAAEKAAAVEVKMPTVVRQAGKKLIHEVKKA